MNSVLCFPWHDMPTYAEHEYEDREGSALEAGFLSHPSPFLDKKLLEAGMALSWHEVVEGGPSFIFFQCGGLNDTYRG